MATNFETFASDRVAKGWFSADEVVELRRAVKQDLRQGPDTLRKGLEFVTADGGTVPATIDDRDERYRLWDEFFAAEAEDVKYRRVAA
jgi:hypothetical protein